jgi:hypothetical protein
MQTGFAGLGADHSTEPLGSLKGGRLAGYLLILALPLTLSLLLALSRRQTLTRSGRVHSCADTAHHKMQRAVFGSCLYVATPELIPAQGVGPQKTAQEDSVSRNGRTLKNGVFWDVTPCGSCKNRRFGGTYHLLHQGDKNR